MTPYEKQLEAKRADDERRRQDLAFQLSNRAPMGQINPYIQAYQMTEGRGGGGMGGGRGGDEGFMKPADLKGERSKEADFIARYGMSPADMIEANRVGQVKEGHSSAGPATIRTGSTMGSSNGLALPSGIADVGQRFREGALIDKTPSEDVKLTDQQKGLISTYGDFRKRYDELSRLKALGGAANAANIKYSAYNTGGEDVPALAEEDTGGGWHWPKWLGGKGDTEDGMMRLQNLKTGKIIKGPKSDKIPAGYKRLLK